MIEPILFNERIVGCRSSFMATERLDADGRCLIIRVCVLKRAYWQTSHIMYQRTTVHLLVGVLLGCPFFCLSELGREKGAEVRAPSCACCSPESSDSQPCHDGSNREQKDCLCRGAIMFPAERVEGGDVEVTPLSAIDHYLEVTNTPVAQSAGEAGPSSFPSHSPPFSSGREICALTGVLLL